jgi:hypothetical protein
MIEPQATVRATPDNQAKSLKPEHTDLFYARILGKVVISSVTDDFYATQVTILLVMVLFSCGSSSLTSIPVLSHTKSS